MQFNSPARRRSTASWPWNDEREDASERTAEEFSLASSDYGEGDEDEDYEDWEHEDWEDEDWEDEDDERWDDDGVEDEREDRSRRAAPGVEGSARRESRSI